MHLGICNGKGIFCHGRLSYEGCGLTTAGRGPLHCARRGHVHPPVTAPAPAALPARDEARAIGQLIVCLGRLPEFSAYPAQQDYASRKCQGGPSARKERGGPRRLPPLLRRQGGGAGARTVVQPATVILLPRYYNDTNIYFLEANQA